MVDVGQLDQAVEMMQQLIEKNPQDRELLIRLSEIYFNNYQAEQAAELLDQFLENSDKSEYVYMRIARLLEQYYLYDRALACYEEMVKVYPNSLSAKESYAEALYRYKDDDSWLELFSQIAVSGDLPTLLRITKTKLLIPLLY